MKAKKHYRYIKRGEVIPGDAEIRVSRGWAPYYSKRVHYALVHNYDYATDEIRIEVKPRKA